MSSKCHGISNGHFIKHPEDVPPPAAVDLRLGQILGDDSMERGTYTGSNWASSRASPPSSLSQVVRLQANHGARRRRLGCGCSAYLGSYNSRPIPPDPTRPTVEDASAGVPDAEVALDRKTVLRDGRGWDLCSAPRGEHGGGAAWASAGTRAAVPVVAVAEV